MRKTEHFLGLVDMIHTTSRLKVKTELNNYSDKNLSSIKIATTSY